MEIYSNMLKFVVTFWVAWLNLQKRTDFYNSDTPSSNSDQTWCRCIRLGYAHSNQILIDGTPHRSIATSKRSEV